MESTNKKYIIWSRPENKKTSTFQQKIVAHFLSQTLSLSFFLGSLFVRDHSNCWYLQYLRLESLTPYLLSKFKPIDLHKFPWDRRLKMLFSLFFMTARFCFVCINFTDYDLLNNLPLCVKHQGESSNRSGVRIKPKFLPEHFNVSGHISDTTRNNKLPLNI